MFQYLVFFLQNVPCCPVRFQLSRLTSHRRSFSYWSSWPAPRRYWLTSRLSFLRRSRLMRTFVRSCLTLVLHVMAPTKKTIHQACGWTASKWQPKRLSFPVTQNHPPFFSGSRTTPTQCHPKSFAISCRITKKHSLKDGSTKARSTSNTGHGHHLLVPSLPLQKS